MATEASARACTGSLRLTRLGADLVQQLHHAFPLHGGPVLDGGAPSDLAVLLLDLWRAAFGDEGPQFAAESTTHTAKRWRVTFTFALRQVFCGCN